MDSIKNILPSSLLRNRIKNQVQACTVLDDFRKLVKNVWGDEVAQFAEPKFVKEKILYIHCSAAPVASALSLAKRKIIEEINKFQGEDTIKDIVFRQ
jgi:hypothetical protein